jgi:predicted kinase
MTFDWLKNPENKKLLILMRGLPSSGKSYHAKKLAGNTPEIIFSADHFFGFTPEEYVKNWCIEELGNAHKQCQKNARIIMQRQKPLVIIDNTNTQIREMMPYFNMAVQYNYRLEIHEPTSEWWVKDIAPYLMDKEGNKNHLMKMAKFLYEKNKETHCVPLASIEKMLFRYQPNVTVDDLIRVGNV